MVSQCANPACEAQFLYFGEGQLIVVRRPPDSRATSNVEFFWLCGTCAAEMSVEVDPKGEVNLVPRPEHTGKHPPTMEVGYELR